MRKPGKQVKYMRKWKLNLLTAALALGCSVAFAGSAASSDVVLTSAEAESLSAAMDSCYVRVVMSEARVTRLEGDLQDRKEQYLAVLNSQSASYERTIAAYKDAQPNWLERRPLEVFLVGLVLGGLFIR